MNNSFFNSAELIGLAGRHKKQLLIVGIVAFAAAAIFSSSFFMPPRYKSFALVYPSNLIAYSNESPTEQMLQIAQSSEIRNKVIQAFDLYKHYGIDTTRNTHYQTDAIGQFEENVSIRKTEYESMEITAYDTDPLIASRIVDSIIHYFNQKARQLQMEKSLEVLIINRDQLQMKKAEMDSMEAELKILRHEYGILDYKAQSERALEGYFRILASGNSRGVKEAEDMISALREKGGAFNELSEHLWRVRGTYNDLKVEYDNAYRDVYKILTYTNVVTKPQPADKKSFPIRWLIVLISVSSSVLFAYIVLLVIDSRKFYSRKENA
ncbi:MAG: hypothetical protein RL213_1606 [Bacteroidota bacterium]|jgi:uncharacterized protein involved in exopolysaccharide biosynthesis